MGFFRIDKRPFIIIVSDTQKFDQINLSINDISTYQTDKYWIAEGSKGLRSIQRKGSNSFEALNEPIILDGPYSNSAFDIVCKNDKVYMIIGGKDLLNGKRFDKGGYILTYDYDKWSFIDSGGYKYIVYCINSSKLLDIQTMPCSCFVKNKYRMVNF